MVEINAEFRILCNSELCNLYRLYITDEIDRRSIDGIIIIIIIIITSSSSSSSSSSGSSSNSSIVVAVLSGDVRGQGSGKNKECSTI
jgi:hypothetical protein